MNAIVVYYSNKGSNEYLAKKIAYNLACDIEKIKRLVSVTCCGSTYDKKDEKFGHGLVFKEVKRMLNGKCILCQAFPVGLVLPDDQKEDPDAFMKTHLSDENFKGEIQERYDTFISEVSQI